MTKLEMVSAAISPGNLKFHDRNRSGFQQYFTEKLAEEPGILGDVLDVGCGPNLPVPLQPLIDRWTRLDGLDPNEKEVLSHPHLANRWAATLEEASINRDSYDLAYSYNVAEHLERPGKFFEKIMDVLKPGGVYWALSNHTLHPFARIVRAIESLQLKQAYANKATVRINNYAAYYRCNSVNQVLRHCPQDRVEKMQFHFYPCMQWDTYFPKPLRFVPHAYDRLFGTRFTSCMMIFMVRIEKRADSNIGLR